MDPDDYEHGLSLAPRTSMHRTRARNLTFAFAAATAALLCLPPLSSFGDRARIDDPDSFARRMLTAHNDLRRDTELPTLRWSDPLAQDAAEVAQDCRFAHSHGPHGENIYARAEPTTPESVIRAWAGEVDDWSMASNRCAEGEKCGHYTQLVWRDTRSVGCAVQRCSQHSPFSGWDEWVLWVCHYDPPGNIRGRAPY